MRAFVGPTCSSCSLHAVVTTAGADRWWCVWCHPAHCSSSEAAVTCSSRLQQLAAQIDCRMATTRLHVAGIPPNTTADDLRQLFAGVARVATLAAALAGMLPLTVALLAWDDSLLRKMLDPPSPELAIGMVSSLGRRHRPHHRPHHCRRPERRP